MTTACLADRLADEIGNGQVVSALFSTFTFRREFFERVPLPLITAEGSKRGLLPVTVIVDRTQFEGAGWGYEVVRAPAGRKWHAKLVALMVEEKGDRSTVMAIGSGNLTRNGWETNLELFHVDAWEEWRVPGAVLAWLRAPWLRSCAFAGWAKDIRLGEKRRHHRSILGSMDEPLWNQLEFVRSGRSWSEAHVVSPFGDLDDDELEAAGSSGPFFDHLLEHARSRRARLTVYLRSEDPAGKRAAGDSRVLARAAKRADLRLRGVVPDGDRRLHAKMLAARVGGHWSVVIGSPNATGPAFTKEAGNIELGCEFRHRGRSLPPGLLPKSTRIALTAVQRPEIRNIKPRWECLEAARYEPKRKRIVLSWKKGHGLFDSRVLLANRDLDADHVNLTTVADRFLETVPRGRERSKFAPDFVPVEMPEDEADVLRSIPPEAMTADDWLERMNGPFDTDTNDTDGSGRDAGRSGGRRRSEPSTRFPWRDRVVALDAALQGFDEAIAQAHTKRAIDHLRSTALGVWRSHDPDNLDLTIEVRAWRRWVRAGLWQLLFRIDRRTGRLRPLSRLAKRLERDVPAHLRDFTIA